MERGVEHSIVTLRVPGLKHHSFVHQTLSLRVQGPKCRVLGPNTILVIVFGPGSLDPQGMTQTMLSIWSRSRKPRTSKNLAEWLCLRSWQHALSSSEKMVVSTCRAPTDSSSPGKPEGSAGGWGTGEGRGASPRPLPGASRSQRSLSASASLSASVQCL